MKHLNSKNPLNLDRMSIRDCNIYKKMKDGTFYPYYFNKVSHCRKGQIFLISQDPSNGKVCLMSKEAIRKLLKEQEDINAEAEKNSPYRFFRNK